MQKSSYSEDVKRALVTLSEVLLLQDGAKNVEALNDLINVSKADNLTPGDIFELIQETSLG